MLLGLLVVESFTLPIFRSGGRTELSFWGWVKNHTIFGPPVEYVPVENYAREMQGVFPWYPVIASVPAFTSMEEAMVYLQSEETGVQRLIRDGALSIIAGRGEFKEYGDLLANVRNDGKYHSVKELVQPNNSEVRDVARVLVQSKDFIRASQEFVDSFTTYQNEVGDYWREPVETINAFTRYYDQIEKLGKADQPECDCDDKAILLCSILRNYLPPDQVYCAFGLWVLDGETTGHMWVVTEGEDGEDRTIEATAGPERKTRGKYIIHGMFNDKYAFSTEIGIREFDLKTIEVEELMARR